MVFVPQSGQHSLVEAVFGLMLNRSWTSKEIAGIKAQHGQWRDFMPRSNDTHVQEVMFGPGGIMQQVSVPASGVIFERVKPDGNIAWRLACDQAALLVNCLEYTSWEEIWPRVSSTISAALRAAGAEDLKISGALFQTIDSFNWVGEINSYRASELLKIDGTSIPSRIDERGHLWHLHQGWFEDEVNAPKGRTLHKVHFDAVEAGLQNAQVKMDTFLQIVFEEPLPMSAFNADSGPLKETFERMHLKNKIILKDLLTENALRSINLK